jgi:uncharacterized membrane protein YgcG
MNNKYFIYALFVTVVTTLFCWANLVQSATRHSGGSSWSSGSHGSGSYGGGYSGGGGHK